MMTYGPDLNLSSSQFSDEDLIAIAQKLVYATPFIIPFSFSSPFCQSKTWEGLSKRTHYRSSYRPVVIVYLRSEQNVVKRNPLLSKKGRLDAEMGRIEFKAFDSCGDFDLYASLLILLKGIILDHTITEILDVPDTALLLISAKEGFANPLIHETASTLLQRAKDVLKGDPDSGLLDPLEEMLDRKESPASYMLNQKRSGQSIIDVMEVQYHHKISALFSRDYS